MAISTRAEQKRSLSQAVLFGAQRQTAGVNRRKAPQQNRPRLAAIPPRAPTPVPELQPAKRSISPTHYFTIP